MRRADEACLVRMVADELELEIVVGGLEQELGAADSKLADAAGAESTADDDRLCIAPDSHLDEALDDGEESLREFLHRAVDDAAGFRVSFGQHLVELLL